MIFKRKCPRCTTLLPLLEKKTRRGEEKRSIIGHARIPGKKMGGGGRNTAWHVLYDSARSRWTSIVGPSNINNWPCPSPGFRPSLGSPDIFMDRGTVPTRLPPSLPPSTLLPAPLSLPSCLPRGFFFLKTSASLNINATLSLHIPPPPRYVFEPHDKILRDFKLRFPPPPPLPPSLPLSPSSPSNLVIYYLRVG